MRSLGWILIHCEWRTQREDGHLQAMERGPQKKLTLQTPLFWPESGGKKMFLLFKPPVCGTLLCQIRTLI